MRRMSEVGHSVNVCIASVLSVLQSPLYTLTLICYAVYMRNRLSNADSLTLPFISFSVLR